MIIDPRRIGRFLARFLIVSTPFLIVVLGLAFLTEILTREDALVELVFEWRFWLGVVLNMLPAIVAVLLVFGLTGQFVKTVYDLSSLGGAIMFLLTSRFGLPSFKPWVKVSNGEIDKGGADIIKRLGGPGNLVVYHDSAVVLERGGRLTDVKFGIKDGKQHFPNLKAFEKIYGVVDLRPKRWVHTVEAMSKEGIPIKWDVEVQYQIDGGDKQPTGKEPYPFSEERVFRAATSNWVFSQGGSEVIGWESQVVVGATTGSLRGILARRRLDELIGLSEADEKASRESIQAKLEEELHQAVPRLGAKILKVNLGNLEVDDAVTQQWIKNWKARWQSWSAGQLAQGEASRIYLYETAKAEAQMELIASITRGLQAQLADQTITPQAIPRIILMRLFSTLDRAAFEASSRIFFPSHALHALDKLEALKQLVEGEEEQSAPAARDGDAL
jgi:hypothetical protein